MKKYIKTLEKEYKTSARFVAGCAITSAKARRATLLITSAPLRKQ